MCFARSWFADDPQASPILIRTMDEAAATLSMLGAHVSLIDLPDYRPYEAAASVILHAEALAEHAALLATRQAAYGRLTLQYLAFGAVVSDADLALARRAVRPLTDAMTVAMAEVDMVLTATTLGPALPFSAFDGEKAVWTPMRTIAFNVTGQPALSIPCGFENGLPLGMQLVAKMGDEDSLCRVGHAFEQATDHAVQRPPL